MLFDDIELLIVLSEAKSLSQAADRLYLSRPGLSQRISQLEKKLGVKLYRRTSMGIEVTEAGRFVTAFARNTAELERELTAQIAAIDESFESTLDIGMSFNDGVALLPRMVAGYMKEEPDARIHLDADYEPRLIEKLRDGRLDFAMLENQPEDPTITNEVLGYKKLVFIGPNKPPYSLITQPLPVETLIVWPMIIYEWESGRHMVGNRYFCERYGLSLEDHNVIACFDTHEAMVEGVKAGLGWCAVPECIYERCRRDPDIVRFKVKTSPMWYPVSIACSSERIPTEAARNFANYVRTHVPEGYFHTDADPYINS